MSWTHEAILSEDNAVKSGGEKGFRKAPFCKETIDEGTCR